jgi:hypothetical protein
MPYHDFGYPFGDIEVSDPHKVEEWVASCEGDCEDEGGISTGHSSCNPGWRDRAESAGGTVVCDPILTSSGWIALVEFPTR